MSSDFYPLKYKITLVGPSNQIEIEAPADTCAPVSIINFQLLKRLGYKKNNLRDITLFYGFALKGKHIAYNTFVRVIAENKKFFLQVFGVKEDFGSPGLILGINFLKEVNFLPHYLQNFSHLYKLIKESRRKCVLIIGEDRKHLDLLYKIKTSLKKNGYEGLLLKDYPDIEEQSNEEKMNLFGGLARFVICENSYPSGHIDELHICSRNNFVTIILQKEGVVGGATLMQASYYLDFSFIKRMMYKPDSLDSSVNKAIKLGELLVAERKKALNKEYKYRQEMIEAIVKEKV